VDEWLPERHLASTDPTSIVRSLAARTSHANDRFHIRARPVAVTLIARFGSAAII
jgi:hypothetical protein